MNIIESLGAAPKAKSGPAPQDPASDGTTLTPDGRENGTFSSFVDGSERGNRPDGSEAKASLSSETSGTEQDTVESPTAITETQDQSAAQATVVVASDPPPVTQIAPYSTQPTKESSPASKPIEGSKISALAPAPKVAVSPEQSPPATDTRTEPAVEGKVGADPLRTTGAMPLGAKKAASDGLQVAAVEVERASPEPQTLPSPKTLSLPLRPNGTITGMPVTNDPVARDLPKEAQDQQFARASADTRRPAVATGSTPPPPPAEPVNPPSASTTVPSTAVGSAQVYANRLSEAYAANRTAQTEASDRPRRGLGENVTVRDAPVRSEKTTVFASARGADLQIAPPAPGLDLVKVFADANVRVSPETSAPSQSVAPQTQTTSQSATAWSPSVPTGLSQLPAGFAERTIIPQLIQAAQTGSAPGVVDLTLEPPELGRIEIVLEIADKGVRASLMAERPWTGDLLRRHADVLAQQFQDAGFSDVNVSFGDNGQTEGGTSEEAASSVGESEPEDQTTRAPAQAVRHASGLLDIRR